MGDGESTKIGQLVDFLMNKLGEVASDEDWKESDGWTGKWTIKGSNMKPRVYMIQGGRFLPTTEREEYTGEVEMSEDTFLDLLDAALAGKGEEVFAEKYAHSHIRYRGQRWVVDSERFRKVLKRLGAMPIRKVL
jgi:hypothetical protein